MSRATQQGMKMENLEYIPTIRDARCLIAADSIPNCRDVLQTYFSRETQSNDIKLLNSLCSAAKSYKLTANSHFLKKYHA